MQDWSRWIRCELLGGLRHGPRHGSAARQHQRSTLARIIGDVATLSVKWNKPLSARLLPVAGKAAGRATEFTDPHLLNGTDSAHHRGRSNRTSRLINPDNDSHVVALPLDYKRTLA